MVSICLQRQYLNRNLPAEKLGRRKLGRQNKIAQIALSTALRGLYTPNPNIGSMKTEFTGFLLIFSCFWSSDFLSFNCICYPNELYGYEKA
jgi:hypothetical protein